MWVIGNDSSQTLRGTDGMSPAADDDMFGFGGHDFLLGYGGNDRMEGGAGADSIHGGEGSDTAIYDHSPTGVRVSLATGRGYGGDAEGDFLYGVENLRGSLHDDTLEGDGGANRLDGGQGRDTLKGAGGDDHLLGGGHNDLLKGGGGADTLDGGSGYDTASYEGSAEGVVVLLEIDHASGGDAYEDELDSIEHLVGSAHDDHLWGNADYNLLRGGRGNDTLKGFGGHDELYGGDGADTLHGGTGPDVLSGELGADTFVFSAREECGTHRDSCDVIVDFSELQGDRIDLSAIDANTLMATNQAFRWIGNDNNYVAEWGAGQLTYKNGYVQGDTNGDFISDFFIEVSAPPLHESAFIL